MTFHGSPRFTTIGFSLSLRIACSAGIESSNALSMKPSVSLSAAWIFFAVFSASICGSMTFHGSPRFTMIGFSLSFRTTISSGTAFVSTSAKYPSASAIAAWIFFAVSRASNAGPTTDHGISLLSQISLSLSFSRTIKAFPELASALERNALMSEMAS